MARRTRLKFGETDILAKVSVRPDGRFQVALDAPYDSTNSHDGVVAEIAVEGAQVTDGTVLVRFVEEQSAPTAATG